MKRKLTFLAVFFLSACCCVLTTAVSAGEEYSAGDSNEFSTALPEIQRFPEVNLQFLKSWDEFASGIRNTGTMGFYKSMNSGLEDNDKKSEWNQKKLWYWTAAGTAVGILVGVANGASGKEFLGYAGIGAIAGALTSIW